MFYRNRLGQFVPNNWVHNLSLVNQEIGADCINAVVEDEWVPDDVSWVADACPIEGANGSEIAISEVADWDVGDFCDLDANMPDLPYVGAKYFRSQDETEERLISEVGLFGPCTPFKLDYYQYQNIEYGANARAGLTAGVIDFSRPPGFDPCDYNHPLNFRLQWSIINTNTGTFRPGSLSDALKGKLRVFYQYPKAPAGSWNCTSESDEFTIATAVSATCDTGTSFEWKARWLAYEVSWEPEEDGQCKLTVYLPDVGVTESVCAPVVPFCYCDAGGMFSITAPIDAGDAQSILAVGPITLEALP